MAESGEGVQQAHRAAPMALKGVEGDPQRPVGQAPRDMNQDLENLQEERVRHHGTRIREKKSCKLALRGLKLALK